MLCKDCEYCAPITLEGVVSRIECRKYGINVDTSSPFKRKCIDEDCDILWRLALESGRGGNNDGR